MIHLKLYTVVFFSSYNFIKFSLICTQTCEKKKTLFNHRIAAQKKINIRFGIISSINIYYKGGEGGA